MKFSRYSWATINLIKHSFYKLQNDLHFITGKDTKKKIMFSVRRLLRLLSFYLVGGFMGPPGLPAHAQHFSGFVQMHTSLGQRGRLFVESSSAAFVSAASAPGAAASDPSTAQSPQSLHVAHTGHSLHAAAASAVIQMAAITRIMLRSFIVYFSIAVRYGFTNKYSQTWVDWWGFEEADRLLYRILLTLGSDCYDLFTFLSCFLFVVSPKIMTL